MVQLNNVVEKIVPFDRNILLLVVGAILLYSSYNSIDNLMNNIFILLFVLIIFDIFIRDNIRINLENKYHKLIFNNTIIILTIDLLFLIAFIQSAVVMVMFTPSVFYLMKMLNEHYLGFSRSSVLVY